MFCETILRQGKGKQGGEQPKIHGPAAEFAQSLKSAFLVPSLSVPERYRAEKDGGGKNQTGR